MFTSSSLVILVISFELVQSALVSNNDNSPVQIVYQYNDARENGYKWGYGLSDKQYATQSGTTINLQDGTQLFLVKGMYSYIGLDNKKYTVLYFADETGYKSMLMVEELAPEEEGAYAAPVGRTSKCLDSKLLAHLVGARLVKEKKDFICNF